MQRCQSVGIFAGQQNSRYMRRLGHQLFQVVVHYRRVNVLDGILKCSYSLQLCNKSSNMTLQTYHHHWDAVEESFNFRIWADLSAQSISLTFPQNFRQLAHILVVNPYADVWRFDDNCLNNKHNISLHFNILIYVFGNYLQNCVIVPALRCQTPFRSHCLYITITHLVIPFTLMDIFIIKYNTCTNWKTK